LVPPPCEELTTREPFFKATRVSPPGTIRTLIVEDDFRLLQIDASMLVRTSVA